MNFPGVVRSNAPVQRNGGGTQSALPIKQCGYGLGPFTTLATEKGSPSVRIM
jgi:hypothetical protein